MLDAVGGAPCARRSRLRPRVLALSVRSVPGSRWRRRCRPPDARAARALIAPTAPRPRSGGHAHARRPVRVHPVTKGLLATRERRSILAARADRHAGDQARRDGYRAPAHARLWLWTSRSPTCATIARARTAPSRLGGHRDSDRGWSLLCAKKATSRRALSLSLRLETATAVDPSLNARRAGRLRLRHRRVRRQRRVPVRGRQRRRGGGRRRVVGGDRRAGGRCGGGVRGGAAVGSDPRRTRRRQRDRRRRRGGGGARAALTPRRSTERQRRHQCHLGLLRAASRSKASAPTMRRWRNHVHSHHDPALAPRPRPLRSTSGWHSTPRTAAAHGAAAAAAVVLGLRLAAPAPASSSSSGPPSRAESASGGGGASTRLSRALAPAPAARCPRRKLTGWQAVLTRCHESGERRSASLASPRNCDGNLSVFACVAASPPPASSSTPTRLLPCLLLPPRRDWQDHGGGGRPASSRCRNWRRRPRPRRLLHRSSRRLLRRHPWRQPQQPGADDGMSHSEAAARMPALARGKKRPRSCREDRRESAAAELPRGAAAPVLDLYAHTRRTRPRTWTRCWTSTGAVRASYCGRSRRME